MYDKTYPKVMISISICIEKCIIIYWLTTTLVLSDFLYCH